jgi:DnaJ-class molecular chaperone
MTPDDSKNKITGGVQTCPDCSGRGWTDNRCATPDSADMCTVCNGRGSDTGGKQCYACHGTGRIEVRKSDKHVCSKCRGAGVYPVPPSMTEDQFAYRPGRK